MEVDHSRSLANRVGADDGERESAFWYFFDDIHTRVLSPIFWRQQRADCSEVNVSILVTYQTNQSDHGNGYHSKRNDTQCK